MFSVKEFIDYCDERIKLLGTTKTEFLRNIGLSETLFIMSLKRGTFPKLENIDLIAKSLGVSVERVLGLDNHAIPEDIKDMENMLIKIPESQRKILEMNIKNIYDIFSEEQRKENSKDD